MKKPTAPPLITVSPRTFRLLKRASIVVGFVAALITLVSHIVMWLH